MRRANSRCDPQAQEESAQWGGKIPTWHPSYPARIAIKGHLARASILAQEGNHRFDCCLFVEILSRLGRQGNRSAGIHKIADFDHMLTLALRALFRRDRADILEIHLNLFHWLAEFVGMGWLF